MLITKALIEHGASVNLQVRGKYGSALAAAVLGSSYCEPKEVMDILIGAGANVDLHLLSGNYGSALVAAAASGTREPVELLIQHGADVNLPVKRGRYGTALIAAIDATFYYRHRHGGVVEDKSPYSILVEQGADVDARPRFGRYGSALAAAAHKCELEFARDLVARGADVNAVLDVGIVRSALQAATCQDSFMFDRSSAIALFLLEHGANVNTTLQDGNTALTSVCCRRMRSLLLDHGAEVLGNEDWICENRKRWSTEASYGGISSSDDEE